jgi:fatty acid desaturase
MSDLRTIPERVGMVPAASVLPDVLPTDRLNARGKATRDLRDELRRIPNIRNAVAVAATLLQSYGVVIAAAVVHTWWAYLLAFVLMARGHVCLNILGHEAAHRLLFSNRQVNDVVGRFLAYSSYQAMLAYRRAHFAHHRDEMGPNEPDASLYAGYPISADSWRRKLRRDATGISAYKNLRVLFLAIRRGKSEALQILALHVVLIGASIAFGRPWAYVVWILSWSTLWRVSNRLRSIAEHGGMIRSRDRRETTHVIRQSLVARYWMVPYHTGWHLAHHVDMGVPWTNLPRFHDELVAAGWVTPELEYASYREFWRAAPTDRLKSADQLGEILHDEIDQEPDHGRAEHGVVPALGVVGAPEPSNAHRDRHDGGDADGEADPRPDAARDADRGQHKGEDDVHQQASHRGNHDRGLERLLRLASGGGWTVERQAQQPAHDTIRLRTRCSEWRRVTERELVG